MSDITSVSQLTDVDPTQCYYKDLQSLIERYGISVGYSDNTFRGEQAMTRAEAV
jgi:S-layer homology domain